MNLLRPTFVLGLISFFALGTKDTNKPLRVELAEEQRTLGYSLADVGWPPGDVVYVVSVEDRTMRATKARDIHKLRSVECYSPDGRYSVFLKNGLRLKDNESEETQQIDVDGLYSNQCFSPEPKFVYFSKNVVKVYDLATKQSTVIGAGNYASWSPDGKWLGFDDGKRYVLLDVKTRVRKDLFSTKHASSANWSPDSRYLTYTQTGGSSGGFLIWGMKCPEPYRVWVWRLEDDAHDWVQGICKPNRSFMWVKNSDLVPQ
jgi:WD40-like Beta Propeller Repeat